jgi:PKD repeat protein
MSTGSPTSWKWSFGDGKYSTAKNPVHVYSKDGKYTVILTVKNIRGRNTVKKSEHISVQNKPQIKITYPSKTAHIVETIKGTAKNIPEGQTVWIVIYPHTAHKYYPINKPDIQNGKWSLPAQFGEAKDTGTKFDTIAVLANKQANEVLSTYLDTCIKNQQWPGILKLPNGVKTFGKVTVKRV